MLPILAIDPGAGRLFHRDCLTTLSVTGMSRESLPVIRLAAAETSRPAKNGGEIPRAPQVGGRVAARCRPRFK
jgi:hypothetical protein